MPSSQLTTADIKEDMLARVRRQIDPEYKKYSKHSVVKVSALKKPNVTIWSKGTTAGDWKVYRVSGEINAKFEDVVKFFKAADTDLKKMKIMAQTASSNEIIKTHEHGVHIKRVDAFPWPLVDRVFLSYRVSEKTDSSFTMACCHDPDFKPACEGSLQKAKLFPGGAIIEKVSDKVTRVTTVGGADLKGNIPAWIVDSFIGDIAHSLGRLQQHFDKKAKKVTAA